MNVFIILLAGIPLELRHDGLIVAVVFFSGSVIGCFANYWGSTTIVIGASGGALPELGMR